MNSTERERLDATFVKLHQAQQALGTSGDGLLCAIAQLIDCALLTTGAAATADVEAAREALGCARAAVVAATYAVRTLADRGRVGVALNRLRIEAPPVFDPPLPAMELGVAPSAVR